MFADASILTTQGQGKAYIYNVDCLKIWQIGNKLFRKQHNSLSNSDCDTVWTNIIVQSVWTRFQHLHLQENVKT